MASSLSFGDDRYASPLMYLNRRNMSRPLLASLYGGLEDNFDQQVGHLFRSLPAVLLELESVKKEKSMDKEPNCKAEISTKGGQYRVKLNTSCFSPEDLSVRVVGDKICISAKRESRSCDGYEYHEMHREFTIPDGVAPDTITSRLSNTGELTIEAPMKAIKDSPSVRTVTIQRDTSEKSTGLKDEKSVSKDIKETE